MHMVRGKLRTVARTPTRTHIKMHTKNAHAPRQPPRAAQLRVVAEPELDAQRLLPLMTLAVAQRVQLARGAGAARLALLLLVMD